MNITKRNGNSEELNLNKIVARIKKQCYSLDTNFVNVDQLAIKVIQGLFDGATTRQIDELIAEQAASASTIHYDYSTLAARILVTSLHKDTSKSFSNTVEKLYSENLVSDIFYKNVQKHKKELDSAIVYDRDFNFDYFGYRTLEKSYLLKDRSGKILERPQHLYMRVAVGIWGDNLEEILKSYEYMSQGYFTHATPTLFNAGTNLPQLSSCFLLKIDEDSLDEIYKILADTAKISKLAGGIGISVSKIRAKNSAIKGTNGKADGLVPMLKVFNETARYVNQSGRRKGSFALYLEPWHDDVFDFIELRKNSGAEELRARDLFLALWVNDLFMDAVNNDGDWWLMCPNESPNLHDFYGQEFETLYKQYVSEGRFRRKIKARDLWMKILENQIETGTPYILYKDSVNEKSNQKNIGVISSSNLCVAPETQLLTKDGYITISEHVGKNVEVWNGEQWSETKIVKTGENQKLITVEFSDGSTLDCTEYHKFYTQRGYYRGTGKDKMVITEKRANELEVGDKLVKFSFPIIEFEKEFKDAYTQGFFTGDGCSYKGKNHIDLFHGKNDLLPFIKGEKMGKYYEDEKRQRIIISNEYIKFEVPLNYSIKSRINWFEGFCDADGVICRNEKTLSLQISSINLDFLRDVKLMLNTLGVSSKITDGTEEGYRNMPNHKDGMSSYFCQKSYRLLIGFDSLVKLKNLGFSPKRLVLSDDIPNRNCEHFIKVKSIDDLGRYDDTYCVNESLRHKVIFNGILTGNCAEIVEYTDKNESAVCNLASIGLTKFVENGTFNFQKLYEVAYQAVKNLDRVIDVNHYPIQETFSSNLKHRPIGLGVQGLADVFAMFEVPFDSEFAKDLNKKIFETIYFASVTSSKNIAKKFGAYSTFEGSPISKGIFQFDMWEDRKVGTKDGKTEILERNPIKLSGMWDWETLREEVKEYGVRNSLMVAAMPTASTSQLLGNNECIEPFTSNIYKRNTLSGTFIVTNKFLIKELIKLGLWDENMKKRIMLADGSVQNIDEIPQRIKDIYKTVWELKMKDIIDMSADRSPFICQTQSLNLFFQNVNFAKLSSALMYGWKKGLKTGSYYIRTKSITEANKALGIDISTINVPNNPTISLTNIVPKMNVQDYSPEDAVTCSLDNPDACMACSG